MPRKSRKLKPLNLAEVSTDTLDVEEVARILGISRNLTYEAVRAGTIPALVFGRRVVVPRTVVAQLLNGTLTTTSPAAPPSVEP